MQAQWESHDHLTFVKGLSQDSFDLPLSMTTWRTIMGLASYLTVSLWSSHLVSLSYLRLLIRVQPTTAVSTNYFSMIPDHVFFSLSISISLSLSPRRVTLPFSFQLLNSSQLKCWAIFKVILAFERQSEPTSYAPQGLGVDSGFWVAPLFWSLNCVLKKVNSYLCEVEGRKHH